MKGIDYGEFEGKFWVKILSIMTCVLHLLGNTSLLKGMGLACATVD